MENSIMLLKDAAEIDLFDYFYSGLEFKYFKVFSSPKRTFRVYGTCLVWISD